MQVAKTCLSFFIDWNPPDSGHLSVNLKESGHILGDLESVRLIGHTQKTQCISFGVG
jgi:hypothetical protein